MRCPSLSSVPRSTPTRTVLPPPTIWTVLRHDGPDHLGVWYNALPGHQMALTTSGCVPCRRGLRDHGPAGVRHLSQPAGGAPRRAGCRGAVLVPPGEPRLTAAIVPMDNLYCSCKRTRARTSRPCGRRSRSRTPRWGRKPPTASCRSCRRRAARRQSFAVATKEMIDPLSYLPT